MITFPSLVRRVLLRVQDGLCASCGRAIRNHFQVSVDHVIARSLGGLDRLGNLLAMHGRCNNLKGNRPPNGCELVWLLAVNARLGVQPMQWRAAA